MGVQDNGRSTGRQRLKYGGETKIENVTMLLNGLPDGKILETHNLSNLVYLFGGGVSSFLPSGRRSTGRCKDPLRLHEMEW